MTSYDIIWWVMTGYLALGCVVITIVFLSTARDMLYALQTFLLIVLMVVSWPFVLLDEIRYARREIKRREK